MNNQMRPNYFEDLVDEEMIRLVSGDDDSVFEFLMGLEQDEQRTAILSIIDKNIGLFDKIMAVMNGEYIPKAQHISNVVEMLRKYVEVGEVEKKKFGEVMTPIWLVEDMLDKLPQEVWTNPELKWLDPCNGCGVFPSVIVKRLMDGLSEWEPEEDKRYKHIIENMIYVCELQAKNMFLHLCAFDPEDVCLLNIFHGSFLSKEFDEHMKNEWGIEAFDVIIGNPPYQELKPGFKKSRAIWPSFVERGLNLCVEGGLFSMIHPAGWREPKGMFKNIQNKLLYYNMIYLSLNSVKDGIKTFGAETSYDWYILKNLESKGEETEIKFQDGSIELINLSGVEFIPNSHMKEIYSLIAKDDEERTDVIYSRSAYGSDKNHMSEEKTDQFKYPVVYMVKSDGTSKIWWSNTNKNGHFNIPKVIFGDGRSPKPFIDMEGNLGLTQFAYAIVDEKENLDAIQKAMCSKRFIDIMKGCALNNPHRYNRKIIALFRKDFWKEFI